jgi:hypothetical protein
MFLVANLSSSKRQAPSPTRLRREPSPARGEGRLAATSAFSPLPSRERAGAVRRPGEGAFAAYTFAHPSLLLPNRQ